MDTSDPDIVFDKDGICNHCHRYKRMVKFRTFTNNKFSYDDQIRIIKRGIRSDFDCIIGGGGGVDSYLLKLALESNLRVLAVHADNGWDSELAVHNIRKLVEGTEEYSTHILNWKEFRELQIAFLKSGTRMVKYPLIML